MIQLKLHLLGRDDGGIGDQGEVDPWVGHQVRIGYKVIGKKFPMRQPPHH